MKNTRAEAAKDSRALSESGQPSFEQDLAFVDVDGLKIRYVVIGKPNGQVPLVIFNGLGQSLEILYPLFEALKGRQLIAFDMPGVGRSQWSCELSSVVDYSNLSLSLMDRIDVDAFDVLGISWGGTVAQQVAHMVPQG